MGVVRDVAGSPKPFRSASRYQVRGSIRVARSKKRPYRLVLSAVVFAAAVVVGAAVVAIVVAVVPVVVIVFVFVAVVIVVVVEVEDAVVVAVIVGIVAIAPKRIASFHKAVRAPPLYSAQ